MRRTLKLFPLLSLLAFASVSAPARAEEPWKGPSPQTDGTISVMTGMSIIGTSVDLGIIGAAAKRIVERGFVPDINDQVFLEVALGPARLIGDGDAWIYGVQLRWDFHYDDQDALYAIGGLGGTIVGEDNTTVHPRFGLGALKTISGSVKLRAEAHSEFIGAGLMFLF